MYLCERKIFAESFSGWGTDRNVIKISCHSRLPFVLHLLVNRIIIMTIARKVVERVFILIQFFPYLRKHGWLFSLGALKRIHPWCAFEWVIWLLYSLELSENHRFLMALVEGCSLTGFLELMLYDSAVPPVFSVALFRVLAFLVLEYVHSTPCKMY